MECLRHSDCIVTGFCPDGTCRKPKAGDPCDGYNNVKNQGSCPSGLFCHFIAKRCKPEDFVYSTTYASCYFDEDCNSDMFCGDYGRCEFKGFLSFECKQGRCQDGSECYNGKCVSRCYGNNECFFDEKCVQSPTEGFRMCIPKSEDTSLFSDYKWHFIWAAVAVCVLIGVIGVIVAIKRSKRKKSTGTFAPLSGPSMPQHSFTPSYQPSPTHQVPQYSEPPPQYPGESPTYQFTEKS